MDKSKSSQLVLTFIIISSIYLGCKTSLTTTTDYDSTSEMIDIAIEDFSQITSLMKKDSAFYLHTTDIGKDVRVVSIMGTNKKFLVDSNTISSRGSIPARYKNISDKIFIWNDTTILINEAIIDTLESYNLIEYNFEGYIVAAQDRIDETKKGANYYFCKNGGYNYKKVVTNRSIRSYEIPKLKCNL